MIHLMIIYDVVNIFSMKNHKSSRKLRVGLNWYPGVNWSTTTIESKRHLMVALQTRFYRILVTYSNMNLIKTKLVVFFLSFIAN